MKVALVLLTLGACGPAQWDRAVVIRHTQHVSLALDTDEHRACSAHCAADASPASCLAGCEDSVVEMGSCRGASGVCADISFLDAVVYEPGRCEQRAPHEVDESIAACHREPHRDRGPSFPDGAATTLAEGIAHMLDRFTFAFLGAF